jgi:threonine dehydrogenase-like Zn-dependent dehydrogenase
MYALRLSPPYHCWLRSSPMSNDSVVRAFVITGPGTAEVRDVEDPVAGAGQVVVDVARAGICGTDVEMFTGDMHYLETGQARYPLRIGHEWTGTVASIGDGVDPAWLGRSVIGDTMLGCGHCERCAGGRQHLCADRYEIGIRNHWPGALAERLPVPASALLALPDGLDAATGALVEPGGNALRAVRAARLEPGERLLVLGPGTIGLLAAMFAASLRAEVHLLGVTPASLEFARSLGFAHVWTRPTLPDLRWDAVLDASNGVDMPAFALDTVMPGGRVVYIGLSGVPSLVDTRAIALADLTVTGVLSASGGLAGAISAYAAGAVDPRPIVAATIGLDGVAAALAGRREDGWGDGPKIHVDPRLGRDR